MAVSLATHFSERGIDVHVVTPVTYDGVDDYPFRVSRGLKPMALYLAACDADIVLSNGAGLYISPYAVLAKTPLIFRHTNYQVSAVEGAGYIDDEVAPLSPWASIFYHVRKKKSLRRVFRDAPKMLIVRFFAKHLVTANIAISDWMAMRQALPRQIRIYEPFPINRFSEVRQSVVSTPGDVVLFLGRLTGEKGVDTLIRSIAILKGRGRRVRCILIGDGVNRSSLEALAKELSVEGLIEFRGRKSGAELLAALSEAPIAVIPSAWEEPFGGVATELLAAGKALIVSERGALAEIVGDAGLTFPNNDPERLASCIERLISDPDLCRAMAVRAATRAELYREDLLVDQYIELFDTVIRDKYRP